MIKENEYIDLAHTIMGMHHFEDGSKNQIAAMLDFAEEYHKRKLLNGKQEDNRSANCMDCGLNYAFFGLDMVLPRSQWLAINPDNDGLLCANCIVARLSKIPGVICVHAIVEVGLSDKTSVATEDASKETDGSIKNKIVKRKQNETRETMIKRIICFFFRHKDGHYPFSSSGNYRRFCLRCGREF